MYTLTAKETREVNHALDIVRMALPVKTSKWPANLRKFGNYIGTYTVVAWNGTCGASLALGYKAYPLVCMLKNVPSGGIYPYLHRVGYVEEKDRQAYAVKTLAERAKLGPWIHIGCYGEAFRSEDILLLAAVARAARRDSVTLVGMRDVECYDTVCRMFTFSVSTGLNFHILAAPKERRPEE